MIQEEPCRGCGRPLFNHPVSNLVARLETDALDGQEAVEAIMDGRELWRVTATGITPVKPAVLDALRRRGNTEGPHVVREHRCTATGAPRTPFPVPGANASAGGSQAAVQSCGSYDPVLGRSGCCSRCGTPPF